MADAVDRLAGDDDLAPLWQAVHARLCRGDATARSVVTVPGAAPGTRRAVDRLLGQVSTARVLRVPLGRLDVALARAGTDAAAVAATACGPIVDRAAGRAEQAAARAGAWQRIDAHPAAAEPALRAWLDRVRAQGRLERAGGAGALLAALDVLAVLPLSDDPVTRPVLAAAVLGGEHDLDDTAPAGRLVVAGLAARAGIDVPADAAGRAGLWAGAGVSLDAVSAPALTLGLRPVVHGPLTDAAVRWADSGVPMVLPAAALAAEPWTVPAGQVVFVCENPSVLETAAAKLGAGSAPVVCVSGMPGRAVSLLLAQLAAGGARLRYHGDFGSGGITIANLVLARHGATPWRMGAGDHAAALERVRAEGRSPSPLAGRVPDASWDPQLAPAIRACGVEVSEEHVIGDLLADLAG